MDVADALFAPKSSPPDVLVAAPPKSVGPEVGGVLKREPAGFWPSPAGFWPKLEPALLFGLPNWKLGVPDVPPNIFPEAGAVVVAALPDGALEELPALKLNSGMAA